MKEHLEILREYTKKEVRPQDHEKVDAEFAVAEAVFGLFLGGGRDLRRLADAMSVDGAERIARITHEVNRAWCAYNGDTSQAAWDVAPAWQIESAIAGVRFHLANPDADDSASHNEWMRHKLADGWSFGEVKDPEAKTHPCLVPFDQLPADQQFKDRLFRTIVHAAA